MLEPLGSAALDGEGAGNRSDDSSEELQDLNDGIPFDFHNEHNNKGYQELKNLRIEHGLLGLNR